MNKVKAQRNYKDTVFRMLFKDEENLLSLYNALNNTVYTDVSGLEITTLENAVYMNYKNAVDYCINAGILSEFLRKNRAEVIMLSIFEYDEEAHHKLLYEEGVEDGIERINKLHSILIDMGRIEDLKRATTDKVYQEQLMSELLTE